MADPELLVLTLERDLDAPRERVFAALTTRADLGRWWGPQGFATTVDALDLRLGGDFRFTMRPPEGEPFHLAGEYVDLAPPHRLAFTFRWEPPDPDDRETTARLALDDVDGRTRVRLTQTGFATEARVALHRDGWGDSFDRLAALLGTGT